MKIRETIVDEALPGTLFACDMHACKGACCTMPGGRGAPLLDAEVSEIRRWSPAVRHLLPPEHLAIIDRTEGIAGKAGDYCTGVLNDRACVFVFMEDGIARCAFEREFSDGHIPWRKPISCHLFPVRVREGEPVELVVERIHECEPAFRRGAASGVRLSDFLGTALTRAFGNDWYRDLTDACNALLRARASS